MQFFTIDPLNDSRWDHLVAGHVDSSVFHRTEWLRALAQTYGYRPVVLTSTGAKDPLDDGIAFCEIKSFITGSRLVSVPFSDHAQPLFANAESVLGIKEWADSPGVRGRWKYLELRPISAQAGWTAGFHNGQSFWLHKLSLAPPLETLFGNLHKNCVRRRIQHAERESLEYERGGSRELLEDFYNLLVITRKRHRILPQPLSWFQNLMRGMRSDAEIRVVRKGNASVAAIFTLRHRDTVVYKYGCSDHRFHHLGGIPLLFWKLIEESKAAGVREIDLGRTDFGNLSLAQFKDRLGATRRAITYLRCPESQSTRSVHLSDESVVGSIFANLPPALSSSLGSLVYRHLG